jgi:sialate O-acetylesterase
LFVLTKSKNAARSEIYRCQLPQFVKDIRALFQQNFLFTYVQLAGFDWGEFRAIRRVMQEVLKDIPKAGMATAMDLGEMRDIHPRKKDELGRRIQLITSAIEYKEDVEFQGPIFKSMTHERNANEMKFKLSFEIFNGKAKGLSFQESTFCTTCCGVNPKGLFMLMAASSKVYYPEMIQLNGNSNEVTFVVKIPQSEKVVEMRYAWEKYSQCVIVSKDFKLPITPFVNKF